MEEDKFVILNNFLDDKAELVNSEYKADFAPLRAAYVEELSQPGCTQCIRNACRSKYTQRIMGILNGEIDPKAPPPVSRQKPPPQPKQEPPQSEAQASQQHLPPPPKPQVIPPQGQKLEIPPRQRNEEDKKDAPSIDPFN